MICKASNSIKATFLSSLYDIKQKTGVYETVSYHFPNLSLLFKILKNNIVIFAKTYYSSPNLTLHPPVIKF